MRDTTRLHKPPSQATALTGTQVDAIRGAVRGWRRGSGVPGPPPDGQLEQIIEVMLGRIGEVLAIRSATWTSLGYERRVRICGTIVSRPGSRPIVNTTPRRCSQPEPYRCRRSPLRRWASG